MPKVVGEITLRVTEAATSVVKGLKPLMRRLAAKNVALPRSRELETQILPHVEDVVAILTWWYGSS